MRRFRVVNGLRSDASSRPTALMLGDRGDMLASFARRRRLPCLPMTLDDVFARIVRRDRSRSEATLQADIRQLILMAPLGLEERNIVDADLETPVGTRRRIDIEAGSCLIEVKRDLSAGSVLAGATILSHGLRRHRRVRRSGPFGLACARSRCSRRLRPRSAPDARDLAVS